MHLPIIHFALGRCSDSFALTCRHSGWQVFKLTPTLNLLEVRHKLGSQTHFTEVSPPVRCSFPPSAITCHLITCERLRASIGCSQLCNELLRVVADLLLFRPGTTPPASMRQIVPSPSPGGPLAASYDSSADPHSPC